MSNELESVKTQYIETEMEGSLFVFKSDPEEKVQISVEVLRTVKPVFGGIYIEANFITRQGLSVEQQQGWARNYEVVSLTTGGKVYYDLRDLASLFAKMGAWGAVSGLTRVGLALDEKPLAPKNTNSYVN